MARGSLSIVVNAADSSPTMPPRHCPTRQCLCQYIEDHLHYKPQGLCKMVCSFCILPDVSWAYNTWVFLKTTYMALIQWILVNLIYSVFVFKLNSVLENLKYRTKIFTFINNFCIKCQLQHKRKYPVQNTFSTLSRLPLTRGCWCFPLRLWLWLLFSACANFHGSLAISLAYYILQ